MMGLSGWLGSVMTMPFGDVLVGDHGTRGFVGGKAGHPSNEPTLLGRRMAGVLECKLFPPAGENRADPLRESSGVCGLLAYRRLTNLEVVGAFRDVPHGAVGFGKFSPGLVDENNDARLVENCYVCGETV